MDEEVKIEEAPIEEALDSVEEVPSEVEVADEAPVVAEEIKEVE